MTFLIDVNLSPLWVRYLADHGFDAVHWSDIGDSRAPDSHLMLYAIEHGMVVLTQDLDFGMHLALGRMARPSVLLLRTEYAGPEVIGEYIVRIINVRLDDLRNGALVTVDDQTSRLKVLPIKSPLKAR